MKQFFINIFSGLVVGVILEVIRKIQEINVILEVVMKWVWENLFFHYWVIWLCILGGLIWFLISNVRREFNQYKIFKNWVEKSEDVVFIRWLDLHSDYKQRYSESLEGRFVVMLEWWNSRKSAT